MTILGQKIDGSPGRGRQAVKIIVAEQVTEAVPWSALTGAWYVATPVKFKFARSPLNMGRLRKFRRLLQARQRRIRTSPEEQERGRLIGPISKAGRINSGRANEDH
jgi:hypothetical protein